MAKEIFITLTLEFTLPILILPAQHYWCLFPRLIDISKFNEPMIDRFLATNHITKKWMNNNSADLVHEVIITSNWLWLNILWNCVEEGTLSLFVLSPNNLGTKNHVNRNQGSILKSIIELFLETEFLILFFIQIFT